MKPTHKALDEALSVTQIPGGNMREYMHRVLEAAYAAQFQGEDYAGLVKMLRSMHKQITSAIKKDDPWEVIDETVPSKAADALEAVLAERDALKSELIDYKDAAASEADFVNEQAEKIRELKAERDALAARLAPVEDEKLVKIAAKAQWKQAWQDAGGTEEDAILISGDDWHQFIEPNRVAIAAIRPHIEAAERERCAKAAKGRYEKLVPASEAARSFRLGRMTAAYEIEGKFKPSKTPPDTNTAQIDVREFVEKLDAPQQSGAGNESD